MPKCVGEPLPRIFQFPSDKTIGRNISATVFGVHLLVLEIMQHMKWGRTDFV